MGYLGRLFLKGLAAILPLGLTLYLLYWIGTTAESLLAPLIKRALPEDLYVPGLGLIAGLLFVFVVGAMMTTYVAKWFLALGERLLARIPGVKTVYSALKDTMKLLGGDRKKDLNQVVLIRVGETDARMLGFMTRDNVDEIEGIDGEDIVAVYLPLAYQIGGFTVLVPRHSVTPVQMTGEDALRFSVTAGMSGLHEVPDQE